ncbi:MAG: HIT domain-containing protein [Candidatus Methanomethylicia archaeon]
MSEFSILHAPWRIKYITMPKTEECIFCTKPKEERDEENYIIHRSSKCFIILNMFPYNTGHLMIAPYRHTSSFEDLTDDESLDLMKLISLALKMLRKAYTPDGFNIGVNIGSAAGAGIVDHVHLHIVPRWIGDTNFMVVISNTKVIPEMLKSTFEKLRKALLELTGS